MDKPTQGEEGATAGPSKALAVATPAATSSNNSSDELPYPPEKFPGKVCVLCNLGERSQLGQGVMLKIAVNDESMEVPERMLVDASGPTDATASSAPGTANSSFEDSDSAVVLSHKRQKNGNKLK